MLLSEGMTAECPGRAGLLDVSTSLPPSIFSHFFISASNSPSPQRSCERLGLGPRLHSSATREGPPRAPSVIISHPLPQGSCPVTSSYGSGESSSSGFLPPWPMPALCAKFCSSSSPAPWRSLNGLSSKSGVWGDTSVRWLRVRAGGGPRRAQNISHMLPVHPPKALPTHSLTGREGTELNPL